MINKYIFFIVLLNFFIYYLSWKLNIERSIVNIDYFLLYIVFIFINNYSKYTLKNIFLFILLLIISTDVLMLLIHIFPFLYIGDFFYLVLFFIGGPDNYKIWFLAIVIFAATTVFCFYKIKYKRIDRKDIVLLFFFILIGKSQLFFFTNDQYMKYKEIEGNHTLKSDMEYEYLIRDVIDAMPNNSKKILLIVNESWGSTKDIGIQDHVLTPIYNNIDHYEYISDGSFTFVGSTISGELRELCQKYANVMNITKVKDDEFFDCLPSKLDQQGYSTYAMHGTDGELYDRKRWYPLAGFNNILFKDSFEDARDCKTFSGKCDYDLFKPVANILANNKKVFLYWLTLNTHSPYDDKLFLDGFDCKQYDIRPDSETCLNLKQQYQFFYRLSEYVQDDRMKGVEVYVVGDHAPPIMSLKESFDVFKDLEVGWLKFKIKD